MNAGRYTTPPDAAKLEGSTAGLKASLDKLESIAPSLVGETEFFAALRERLKLGAAAYGERSFSRDPAELLVELEQEALDLAGWGYVLFVRLRRLQAAVRAAGIK